VGALHPGSNALLDIRNLTVDYLTPLGPARAVDRVSFSIDRGEVFGLAGESGCGKSTVAHAIMRLIQPPGQISDGQMLFQGHDILTLSRKELQDFRWSKVSIVFQSAMNALNPVLPVGAQMSDAIRAHQKMSRSQAYERAAELFRLGSGRDGESPPHPPVRTRRADFPHRAPQNRSVAQARHD